MTAPVRTVIALSRPPALVILGMFAALGMAQAGAGLPTWLFARALVVVAGYLIFSAALNDIVDVSVDRVNLPGDRRRPLVTGDATAHDLRVIAAVAGTAMLVGAISLGRFAFVVASVGLVVSASYSLRPFRFCDRGVIGALILPAAYVAVPYLIGAAGVTSPPGWRSLVLLPGLYAGFMGRIVLKDFRDVRGDRLFGKRTFVVRHGRRATCIFSGVLSVLGGASLSLVQPTVIPAAVVAVSTVASLELLRRLCANRRPRQDERIISAVAIVGRGMVLALIVSDCIVTAGWGLPIRGALLAVLMAVSLGQARAMVRFGPSGFRLVSPTGSPPLSQSELSSLALPEGEGAPVDLVRAPLPTI